MTADDAGLVADRREELDLLVERNDFVVVDSKRIAVALELLGPSDQESEIGRLGELGELARLWRGDDPRPYPDRLEMLRNGRGDVAIEGAHVLFVGDQLVGHPCVLSAYGTVRDSRPAPLVDRAGGPDCDGTVDHCSGWL